MCQFPLGNVVITEVLPTKLLDGHSQLGPKKIVNVLYVFLKNFRYIFCPSMMVNVFILFSCRISLCIDSCPENFIFVHC
jgi:hypothetical protein